MITKLAFEIPISSIPISSDRALNFFEIILYIKIKKSVIPYFSYRVIKIDNIGQRTP